MCHGSAPDLNSQLKPNVRQLASIHAKRSPVASDTSTARPRLCVLVPGTAIGASPGFKYQRWPFHVRIDVLLTIGAVVYRARKPRSCVVRSRYVSPWLVGLNGLMPSACAWRRIASHACAASQCSRPYGRIERNRYAGISPGLMLARSAGRRTGLTSRLTCGRISRL